MPRLVIALLSSLLVSLASGCGPLISSYLIISAQAELDGADAAQGERFAPYEYTAATEYLAKAREEQGYADFGPSIDYAFKANELAVKAKERAEKERSKAQGPGEMPPGVVAPPPNNDGAPSRTPNVIIEKVPEKDVGGEPVGIEIVPIPTEEGTRPPN